jgi:acyl carrier protein
VITMNSQEEIYQQVVSTLEELFEIDPRQVSLQARLSEDLDIDSIDAVDLVVELKSLTGKKIQPEDFKSVRSVQDVVDAIVKLLN